MKKLSLRLCLMITLALLLMEGVSNLMAIQRPPRPERPANARNGDDDDDDDDNDDDEDDDNERGMTRFQQASILPDLSGMVWLGDNEFLAVHDAKLGDGEASLPRMSLLYVPETENDTRGVFFRSGTVSFRGMKSNDLESAARVPGTNIVLFAESGDDNTVQNPTNPQIYKARLTRNGVRIVGVTPWPAVNNSNNNNMIFNVEATAVALLGDKYVFLYAERADGQASTDVNWASFDPDTMEFGEFSSVTFNSPDPAAYDRPLVAMDLDSNGQIYIASAFDPENAFPDSVADNGPFASAVYRIGQLVEDAGEPKVELYPPVLEGQCDGFKVESVAIRETEEEGLRIFVGVDDENYGATMRQLPPLPQTP